MPLEYKTIQAGKHLGHLVSEPSQNVESSGDVSLMRKFREKLEASKRYADAFFRRDFL